MNKSHAPDIPTPNGTHRENDRHVWWKAWSWCVKVSLGWLVLGSSQKKKAATHDSSWPEQRHCDYISDSNPFQKYLPKYSIFFVVNIRAICMMTLCDVWQCFYSCDLSFLLDQVRWYYPIKKVRWYQVCDLILYDLFMGIGFLRLYLYVQTFLILPLFDPFLPW